MPPGRKQKDSKTFKAPSNYVHPSLALRESPSNRTHASVAVSAASVSERIEHLRRTQGQRTTSLTSVQEPTLHSSYRLSSRRRPAGPPPPRSWLQDDGGKRSFKHGFSSGNQQHCRPSTFSYFPRSAWPMENTLLHHTLKLMARNFDWHVEFGHVYLSVLPVELKDMLLSYTAAYGQQGAVSMRSLKDLFVGDAAMVDSTGCEDLQRLDLGGSVGRTLMLKQLEKFWRLNVKGPSPARLADSWDIELSLSSKARFPNLRMLSLAYPGDAVTWIDLLSFSRHLGALTHLSLAYWPEPKFPSSAPLTSNDNATSRDLSEGSDAAYILKQFSRATPSLRYLSLEGCSDWLCTLRNAQLLPGRRTAVRSTDFGSRAFEHNHSVLDHNIWTSSWRHLSSVRLGHAYIPDGADPRILFKLFHSRSAFETLSSFTLPAEPMPPPVTSVLQPRLFPSRRNADTTDAVPSSLLQLPIHSLEPALRSNHVHQESYVVTAPASIADSIEAAARRREWYRLELQALSVAHWLEMCRRHAGQKPCAIDYGWDKQELIKQGYDESDLFHAGF